MTAPRFYVSADDATLGHDVWLHNRSLIDCWQDLKLIPGQEVVLFDGVDIDRMYKIDQLNDQEIHLLHITDMKRHLPKRNVYLLWNLAGADLTKQILKECTALGVSHFLPLLGDTPETFNHAEAQSIVIEATEQAGRSDIPTVREPLHLVKAVEQLAGKVQFFACGPEGQEAIEETVEELGLCIPPATGWSDVERQLFSEKGISYLKVDAGSVERQAVAAAQLVQ